MKTTVEFLDALKARLDLPSDYALAKRLGVTHTRISNYRTQSNYFDEEMCLRVAEILDLEPAHVLACIAAERAKEAAVKKAWMRAAAATAVVVLAFAVTSEDFPPLSPLAAIDGEYVKAFERCVLCKILDVKETPRSKNRP